MNNRTVLHIIFVKTKNKLVAIPLSGVFEADILYPIGGLQAPDSVGYIVRIRPAENLPIGAMEQSVASVTTIFGENGCGKTDLLLALCRAGSIQKKGSVQVGLLWENDSGIYLSKGSVLKDVKVEVVDFQVGMHPLPVISTSFYTTSPFENARRARLRSQGVNDVSPVFGGANEFDAAALFSVYPFLAGREPFLDRARIEVKVRMPSVKSLIETYGPEKYIANWNRKKSDFQARLRRLDEELTLNLRHRIAIAFLLWSNEPGGRAFDLAQDLVNLIGGVSGDTPSGVDDLSNQSLSSAVEDLLVNLESNDSSCPSISSVLNFISNLFQGNQNQTRVAMLQNLDSLMGQAIRLGEKDFEILNNLGLLRWRFTELSSGQIGMLMLYVAIARSLSLEKFKSDKEFIHLLCIDEGEMFMHPRWQRAYIAGLLNFMEKFPEVAQRTHLMISSHSLIVAADTPPGRLFDLDKNIMVNGFGLNPKQTLEQVFNVDEFAGEYSSGVFRQVTTVLRENRASLDDMKAAFKVAATLSDPILRAYIERELNRIAGMQYAQD